ncbi:mucin-binding protein, partial [Limosilactobacillus caviae]|uniref:mucin-binding protein n=1 Tax=Limosilactobacillus caviae TaxID=1769424 RepID=UPI001E4A5D25
MLSHNNWEEQIKKYEPKKQRFTIKKLSVGVASVLLGVTFAAGTASADSTTANADSASGSDSAEQTDHNLTLNSTSTSTLKSATAASQSNSASAAVQNPAGDVKAQAANDYEAAVSAAVANASSDVASDAVQNSSASSVQSSSAADSSAQASAVKSTATQAFSVRSAAVNNFNYASVFASLAAMQQSNNDNAAAQADTNAADSEYSNYKTVTNAYELQNAISDYRISGVNVKGNINPFGDLNINRAFTIHGVDGAVLNLSQNKIVNNGQLTLVDVTVNGSVTGNGTVNIKGTVNSNVNDFNSVTFGSVNELKQQIGSTLSGASVNNWKAANIAASNVNIEQGATLNINRSITGDGIAEPDGGKINVDINASLNVNLKDAQTASRANEQSSSLDNASAGVRILDNGTFTSGDSAKINIHAGHGRAVVINEPFGGTGAVASNTILGEWENGRTGDRSTEAAKHRNTMILGDSTTMNITGRGGIVLGYTATFVTGDHSIIHIDNQGNGEGLLLDANSKVIVSPHSQLLMTSNGKNASGSYDGGNYIGMGQDAKFRVEHDAVFRYRLTNSMNNEKRPYADNFNIISQASNTHPEVYVGNNATFDGQSDYDDYYGEIFAFSLTSGANTSTVFQIDGAKYVNWEKNSQVIRHNGAGNLFYSMDAGLIDATGQKYYVFKWNNKNLNDNNYTFDDSSSESIAQSIANFKNSSDKYWTDIEHLATKYSKSGNTAEWPGHVVSGNDITAGSGYNPVDKKTGTPIGNYNTGDGDDAHTTGFDPLNSQRLVLVASIIPTQEDKTSQEVDNYDVKIVYDENLKPGQVQLVQKGVNGLKRTTTTTYYNVDPSTGEKTLDTSKGINGVSTTTTVLNQKQDEIIHIGKQTATINYLKQTGNSTATPITDENGKAIGGTVTGKPVQTDAQGNVKFDAAGNATANTIDYTNYESDLNNAEENASGYKYSANDDEWAQAVKDGTNKYNVSGLTKEAIQKAAENAGLNTVATITNEGPVFNVVLKKAVKENASLKIVDDTENGKTLNILNATGDENTAISFENGASTVQDYLNKGYKFVSVVSDANGNILSTTNYDAANFGNYDTDPNSDQSFTVHLVHTYAPVNPNNPHEGVNPDQYEKTVNETVHYKYSDGSKAADDNIQTSKWSRTLTLDNVTGKIVPNGEYDKDWSIEPGQPTEYKQVDSPVIKGYYADQANVPATKVTQDDIEKTVTYKPLGHIIPVDPTTDDPIPNAPQPQFPNDPNDPTKGNPGEKPTVPGYHPESGKPGDKVTPNPGNPGEDVKVPYVKDQGTVSVIFHDDTTDSTIPNVGFNSGDAAADTPVTYNPEKSISDLEKQGYVYVRTEGTLPDKVEANKNITVTVHMKHGVQPVTPTTPPTDVPKNTPKEAQPDQLTKKVNLTVNYVNADGTTFNGNVPANAKQTATFTGTAYVDKITGQLVNAKQEDGKWVINTDDTATPEITWTSDKTSFEGVTSPAEARYHVSNVSSHADGDNVAAITGLTKDSQDINVTVTYAKNGTDIQNEQHVPASQTVQYVDDQGNTLRPDKSQNFEFNYSGDTVDKVTGATIKYGIWNETSHNFAAADVPVIDGYVAVSGYTNNNGKYTAGGFTATNTGSEEDNNKVFKVVYKKVGKIVPVDPDHNPIPDAPTPTYVNDPVDPTKVKPNEKTPDVPGWHTDTPNVTPTDPTEDTPVVYNRDVQDQTVTVKYFDDTKETDLSSYNKSISAKPGEALNYSTQSSIKELEDKGYKLVSDNFNVTTMPEKGGSYEVHFVHNTTTITPDKPGNPGEPINPNDPEGPKWPEGTDAKALTKQGTQTVHYVYTDGTKAADDNVQNTTFAHTLVFDNVTGKQIEDKGWAPESHTFNNVTSPEIDGYHADKKTVDGATVTVNDPTSETTVTYAKNDTEIKNRQEVKASQVVKYVDENDNELSKTRNQDFTFVYTGDTYDKETGKQIATGKWLAVSHDFNSEDVPVVDGYVAVKGFTRDDNDKVVAGGFTTAYDATDAKRNRVFKVVYKKVGKIVPQLPDGKPVPNVPNVPYTNDPTDPTAVTPDEPTPQDPTGTYTPEVPTVTPEVPTKDTPVIYHANEASLKVEYIDQDDNNAVLHTDSVDGKLGEKLTYTTADEIKSLEGQGYVLVSDGFTGKAGADFTKENNGKTYQVILKHGVQPVTPTTPPTDVPKNTPKEAQPDQLTKKVNLTVNYVNADGTAFTGKVPANAKQTATFTGTAYVDKITGKLVNAKQEDGKWVINTDDTATPEITWTSDKTSFEGVTSPAEENYHVSNVSSHKDGDNVAAITGLTKDSGNIDVTVTYAKNGTTVINGKKVTPTQTVKFVDGEGNELAKAITTTGADFVYSGDTRDEVTGQITKTGSWDSTSHIFGTQDVPVIDGYVAVSGYTNQNGKFVAGGLTATLDDPNVVATVVYQKVGNIVPQLPDGTPVPNPDKPGENVPNKPYTNDPTNPTDVNPKEPVPNIPGYRPEVPTVTPEVPTKDTPVVYNQIQKADLTIVDQDNGNKQIVASGVTTKFAADGINGEAITFTGNEAAVKALENMGYVYVDSDFTSGTKFDGDGATDQHFTITMKHGHQPVNPNEPGKPGQPINPNDPEGPKYPQGSDQVTKNVTRTIQYVDENGNKVSDSVEQPVNFTAKGVLDKVTGQWVTPLTWSGSQTINGVKSPVVEGYHLVSVDRDGEGNNVKGVTLTHENDSYTVTVKYAKNGKIIPVDPTGKPIPNVPTPQYPTDPTDPSKVTPNEPVPSIPGLTPEVPTVTPTDPGKNTPVKYSQTVNATVNYIDNVTGKTLKTDSLSGLEGVKSDYSTKSSIDGYEAQGYKLVKDGFPKDGYIFEVGGEHTFNVYLTHTTSPVTPDHPGAGYSATDLKKTVTRTINYLDGQGNVVAQQVAQSFDFIANGTVDNVTHKLVTVVDGKITGAGELTWNAANHDFDAVESPAVKGMHVTNVTPADQRDGNNVAKTTVNAQSGNIIVNVYYASNGTHQDGAKNLPSTQTVTFVDEAGNVLHVPSTLDFTFVRTPDVTDPEGNVTEGTWTTGTSHTYKTVNVPVIPGYVTDRTVAGGMTATIDNLDVADKVVYKKVGKIIPVDPTGKPIPGAPTPDYPNDPQNPTKVTPDEPVPSVPGYTPDVPTVTPGVPTVDTPVTYRQNVQATVTYIDDVTNTVLDSDSLSGLDGKKSDYSTAGKIANYESHGYALVSDDFPKDGYTFSVEGTHNFTVHLTHSTSPVNPDHPGAGYNKTDLQKDVTRTIYFVNTQDGKQVAEPVNQTVSFTANGTVDNVTGKLVTVTDGKITGPGELTWTSAQDVKGVQSPAVNGMHVTYVTRDADGTNVKGVSLTHNDSSYDVYVNYAPNGTTNEHGQNIPASQTIKFVDESGNTLRENNVQTSEFVRTPDVVDAFTGKTITEGSWNETSHKFDVIDVPVIEGYVATVKTAGGLTATTDNPNVVTEVVYKKVGKIIPVDPTGKPIPNVPTPEYPNDPTDPTKVTPNEPVPTIPGYTPETPTVTPEVPTKDTPVKYTPVDNTQNAQVRYIDLTNNEEIANSGNLSGQPGDKINYSTADTIKSLTDKGYVLVNDGFPADAAFDNDKGHDQVFTVTFRHGTQPVNPNEPGKPGQPINPNDPEGPKYPQGSDQVTKNVTRTVQYVDENGN